MGVRTLSRAQEYRQTHGLQFNTPGQFTAQAEEQRREQDEQQAEASRQAQLAARGLVPDTIDGEERYVPAVPPKCEWWDEPFITRREYLFTHQLVGEHIRHDDITGYVQHPVLEEHDEHSAPPQLRLTRKEQRRLRRNARVEQRKDVQDRVTLGLLPAPKPKVRLLNLPAVLANELVADPTLVEARVRQDIADRAASHERTNAERLAEAALMRPARNESKHQKQLEQRGIHAAAFRINTLDNPKHSFKVGACAGKWQLVGICVTAPTFVLVVVEGTEKGVVEFGKAMGRIRWTEAPYNRDENHQVVEGVNNAPEYATNRCTPVWHGTVDRFHFQRWLRATCGDEPAAVAELRRFHYDHLWKQARRS